MRRYQFVLMLCLPSILHAQQMTPSLNSKVYTHADSLRGGIGPERSWWDLLQYELTVEPDYAAKAVRGTNIVLFKVLSAGQTMQIDLQEPMKLVSATSNKKKLSFTREGNVFHVKFPKVLKPGLVETIELKYEGVPKAAAAPGYFGGWSWAKDEKGRPWIGVAQEKHGVSSWLPCKDHPDDEPDLGVVMHIICADSLVGIGNGRLIDQKPNGNKTTTYTWKIRNPINSYNISPYIGKYVNWKSTFSGEKGNLDCDFWVLDYNLEKSKEQFKEVASMLSAFEYWMGPYPFYEDGYKLVDASFLGMEHQSNIAYGNHYKKGYLGKDLSSTDWGLKWDYIIVHESGHEWFGNNLTAKDFADMWLQEGFTTYTEIMFTTYYYGVEAGNDYAIGLRKMIANKYPIIGTYGVSSEWSADMYPKGATVLHMLRQIMGDEKFRSVLHELSSKYYHKTTTSKEVEALFSERAGKDLSKFFDQYLRTIDIPVLQYRAEGKTIRYRWSNCIKGFKMPVKVFVGGQSSQWITPTEEWQSVAISSEAAALPAAESKKTLELVGAVGNGTGGDINFSVERNFYVVVELAR